MQKPDPRTEARPRERVPSARARPAILLMGPTASGKSALAMELARAFPVEIVSVDSAQVYRGMDIGTAKPSAAERLAVPHHLIDIVDPSEAYSVARFRADAVHAARAIAGRGRVPLMVGGTMMYFKALREGLSDLPHSDAALRARIAAEAAALGWPALHARLAALDPETARRLKPTDSQRIQRALEVMQLSGRPLSTLLAERTPAPPQFDMVAVALAPGDRAVLHRRIADRFLAMLKNGLVEELRMLRSRYALGPELPSMRCVGYRQAWRFLEGELDSDGLRERGIHATRQLAKRQLTWLRATQAQTFDCLSADLHDQVRRYLDTQLGRGGQAARPDS